ncbi:MAG: hypothetical protein D6732_19455 [Methanobacteriota archaeon]|nr:MAG: hypothetical protein D6732_19455 [Euryarchaeota archaeon]
MNLSTTCLNCGLEMDNFAEAFKNGCRQCGGRKFSTMKITKNNDTVRSIINRINIANEVAVRVSGRGSYNINLEQLLKRKPNEPIAFQDPTGTIRLVLNPELE